MDPANHMTWFNDGMLESTDQTTWHLITKQGLSTQPTPSMPTKPNDACTEHVIFDIFKLCRECLLGGQVNCFYPLSLAQDFSCKLSYSQNFPLSSQRLIDSSLLIFSSRTNDRILIYFICEMLIHPHQTHETIRPRDPPDQTHRAHGVRQDVYKQEMGICQVSEPWLSRHKIKLDKI